ncbi:MAG: MerR family transcriptional regulator [Flavobacteriaceae bacterium]|nr:MerR family transcriptional regulator [Flavobacteriaceae bacterium]
MDRVKTNFSIKNLEHLSGIKAHTIRIWEKRYNLFEPERTETNIRFYNLDSLQKLLNISMLYQNGFKISKIAKMETNEIKEKVHTITIQKSPYDWSLGLFKLSMINFDQRLFTNTFDELIEKMSFGEIYQSIFTPLMIELGVLWQTNSISPSHEHFITSLIKQKIHSLCEKLQENQPQNSDQTFVLYLPDNEIHELGLLYLNYEILDRGHKTIFLGQSVPTTSLSNFQDKSDKMIFVSCFTIEPNYDRVDEYLEDFENEVLSAKGAELWVTGYQAKHIAKPKNPRIRIFESSAELIKEL